MTTLKRMWRTRWHEDMSRIARALDLDPETTPEDGGLDAILYAIARVRQDAAREALAAIADDLDLWDDLDDGAGPLYGTVATRIRNHRDTHYPEEDNG